MTLTCGCIRGRVNCPEAQRLWDVVADAHRALVAKWNADPADGFGESSKGLSDAQHSYDDAKAAYDAHVAAAVPEQARAL